MHEVNTRPTFQVLTKPLSGTKQQVTQRLTVEPFGSLQKITIRESIN